MEQNTQPVAAEAPAVAAPVATPAAAPADAPQPAPSYFMTVLTTALVSTVFTLLALAPVAYSIYKHTPPQVATVDLQKLVEEDQKRLLDLIGVGSSPDKGALADKMTAEFAKKLSVVVDEVGKECHCVLVNKAALLAGTATDYTDIVRERIKK
ncbi:MULTISPECIES: TrbI F-type domain-containing protein [Burkholderiaceae]|jgi:hypothetical protein|uniref:Type-F conjugative transfer system protein TrbI n=1 Tax=Ralstonia pickettii TaxID=329 RepID=A0AAW4QCI7_RALPI|nr:MULTISPECIES: TrbI F-type domain-containing protein [Burkholderiaceae]UCF21859.1 MAG: hypothetical protein JSV72_12650 [Ralstonia sp.]UNK04314.1 type-F conjugative transfer system protein TrbI [Ralstonia insidiosa]MBX3756421.1 type-F conjugative transfer system protein TrbI [Ralstonia pickettii]MBX3785593.1 type-F conjugative transfer system protein TrbI [Ralstonia pickettii]MBX3790525.1 type-F conjugative transfer system protein TrbI [Ralstonia pickettii]